MFDIFSKNISNTFRWNEKEYQVFKSLWDKHFSLSTDNGRFHFIYTKAYFEHLLSLFFVVQQVDLSSQRVINPKVTLLVLLYFYLGQDIRLNYQTKESLTALEMYLNDLRNASLLSKEDVVYTLHLLCMFSEDKTSSDLVASQNDGFLIDDLLKSTNPIVVSKRACMYFYSDPLKTTFKFFKEDRLALTSKMFFDASFKNGQSIQDKFLRELYMAHLHNLMEVESLKHIFPFEKK